MCVVWRAENPRGPEEQAIIDASNAAGEVGVKATQCIELSAQDERSRAGSSYRELRALVEEQLLVGGKRQRKPSRFADFAY